MTVMRRAREGVANAMLLIHCARAHQPTLPGPQTRPKLIVRNTLEANVIILKLHEAKEFYWAHLIDYRKKNPQEIIKNID